MKISVKRIYEPMAKSDGFRVLIDRVWPRGLSKSDAKLDLWLPDFGPSTTLRKWFNHDPARWTEFCRRYRDELKEREALLATIKKQVTTRPVTLLYSAKDKRHNQAVALRSFLLTRTALHKPITRVQKKALTIASKRK
ncbi:MAG: DUF488 domain-containing protein [Nitrospira sp.]